MSDSTLQQHVPEVPVPCGAEDSTEGGLQILLREVRRVVQDAIKDIKESGTAASASQPVKEVGGVVLPNGERLKASELRTALLLGKVPETAGLLIDTETTARLLNVSNRTLYRLDQEQAVPSPVRIGTRIIRWRLAEILAWMDAGCPPRRAWQYPAPSRQGASVRESPVRKIEYKNVLTPSAAYLEAAGTLFLNSEQMAEFLGLPRRVLSQLVYTDRIPIPVRLGTGKCFRWSVLELAEWIEAGCPRRDSWIEMRGHSGWVHRHHSWQ